MDRIIFIFGLFMFLEPFGPHHEGGSVCGRVYDAIDGTAIAGALVVVGEDQFGALSDEHGEFSIPRVPPGEYLFRVEYKSYTPWILHQFTLKRDTVILLDIALMNPRKLLHQFTPSSEQRRLFYHPDDPGR
ncbi:MAG TPA: carboxypeptidase-like regulatory domain-containing protein [Bacteroidota bacterium]|nr:carboxypeptidase-like regulatory domain-containing protein [Bacteroidota bacterium]